MTNGERISLEQIQAFLEGSGAVEFAAQNRTERYSWIEGVLLGQEYKKLGKAAKGLVRGYIEKMTGLSRAQTTRLIKSYLDGQAVKPRQYRRRRFPQLYTAADIGLLVEVDTAHETLSGPATRKILYREFHDFGDVRFERLAGLSVAHLYRLRGSRTYRTKRTVYQPTRPNKVAIGERRKPDPQGIPGYLRVDTVHQGDRDGVKGLYHINSVDEVTQWEVVGATAFISETWLIPVLKAMLEQFPFPIRGFHSDNGSEFINETVSKLLNKLLVEQTKSRPRPKQRQRTGGSQERGDHSQAYRLWAHLVGSRRGRGSIPSGVFESIFELPPAVRGAGDHHRCEGQGTPKVSVVRDALGNPASASWGGWIPSRRPHGGSNECHGECTIRHHSGRRDAGSQAQTVQPTASRTGKAHRATEAVEMTGYGKAGKPKAGFPAFPQPLEIALRFPHFHRPPTIPQLKTNHSKGHPQRSLRSRPSGSFLNEKMLSCTDTVMKLSR